MLLKRNNSTKYCHNLYPLREHTLCNKRVSGGGGTKEQVKIGEVRRPNNGWNKVGDRVVAVGAEQITEWHEGFNFSDSFHYGRGLGCAIH